MIHLTFVRPSLSSHIQAASLGFGMRARILSPFSGHRFTESTKQTSSAFPFLQTPCFSLHGAHKRLFLERAIE